jgi:hypothetical protein
MKTLWRHFDALATFHNAINDRFAQFWRCRYQVYAMPARPAGMERRPAGTFVTGVGSDRGLNGE